jgi:hypothetical protein
MLCLFEDGAAGAAQAAPLPPETGRDGADVGDFASAQAIDVRCAGLALLWRADGVRRAGREQREKQTRGPYRRGAAGRCRKTSKSCLHDSLPLVFATTQWRVV